MKIPSFRQLSIIQGSYLFLTGIWPLASINSFLYFTGSKTDLWLVTTVGVLLAVIGTVLGISGVRNSRNAEFVVLGMGMAASLLVIDIYFVMVGAISAVYLLDALVELGFALMWPLTVIYNGDRIPGKPLS